MTDLGQEALSALLGSRPFRTYPALVSTGADAQAWARAGAGDGAVVVADYQVAPRGRAGLLWQTSPGLSLCFSMVLHPRLVAEEEGWMYLAALVGVLDAVSSDRVEPDYELWWPDEVRDGVRRIAAVGVDSDLDAHGVTWAVINVLIEDARPDRAALLVRAVGGIEGRLGQVRQTVADDAAARCATIGRRVRARMIPLGPAGPVVEGVARSWLPDGALAISTASGAGVAVRPQHLGLLEIRAEGESESIAATEIGEGWRRGSG